MGPGDRVRDGELRELLEEVRAQDRQVGTLFETVGAFPADLRAPTLGRSLADQLEELLAASPRPPRASESDGPSTPLHGFVLRA